MQRSQKCYLAFQASLCYTLTRCKARKNKVLKGSPISGVRLYIFDIYLPRQSPDVHASMFAWLVAARK